MTGGPDEAVDAGPDDLDRVVDALVGAKEAHVLLESGHHGALWLDLDGLFAAPGHVEQVVRELARRLGPYDAQVVCGPLVGGALLGCLVAVRLGLPFVHAERREPVPGRLWSARYEIPSTQAPLLRGLRVAVVDDVVNAGSAVRGTVASVAAAGGRPVVVGALLRLGDAALDALSAAGVPLETLAVRPGQLWEPRQCPLCAAGRPLQDPAAGSPVRATRSD